MRPEIIENARIESTFLGIEDHGLLTISITLSGSAWHQSFGGYALDGKPAERGGNRVPTALCGAWVADLLRVLGVKSWEQLRGQLVRVARDESYGPITRIGHIFEDRWFTPECAEAATKGGIA